MNKRFIRWGLGKNRRPQRDRSNNPMLKQNSLKYFLVFSTNDVKDANNKEKALSNFVIFITY